jgi:hypothetical protein
MAVIQGIPMAIPRGRASAPPHGRSAGPQRAAAPARGRAATGTAASATTVRRERVAPRISERTKGRLRPVAIVIVFVIAATALGLGYLSLTLRSAAATYQINALTSERQQLLMQTHSQQGVIARYGSETEIVQWAQRDGLSRLGGKLRLPAR